MNHLLRVALVVMMTARTACAQSGTWVEVERREPLTTGRTAEDVKRDALYGAIAEAVRRVVGVHVQGTEIATRAESAGRVIDRYSEAVRLDAAGRATDWQLVRENWKPAPKGSPGAPVIYELVLRVKVERESGSADPGFCVRIDLNADRLLVRDDDPRNNDELVARVTSTRDAWLTLVVIADDSVFVLAPSAYVAAPVLTAGRTTELPPAASRSAGLRFRASLPSGVTARDEIVAAIATVRPITLPAPAGVGAARDTGVLTLAEFNRWLVGIPLGERALAQTVVEVRKGR
jgi:hypothetical protein